MNEEILQILEKKKAEWEANKEQLDKEFIDIARVVLGEDYVKKFLSNEPTTDTCSVTPITIAGGSDTSTVKKYYIPLWLVLIIVAITALIVWLIIKWVKRR